MWNIVASSAADSSVGLGEEAAGKHLERQVPRRVGKVDVVQEGLGVDVVERLVGLGHRHRGQRSSGAGVDAIRSRSRKVGLRRRSQCIPRRVAR